MAIGMTFEQRALVRKEVRLTQMKMAYIDILERIRFNQKRLEEEYAREFEDEVAVRFYVSRIMALDSTRKVLSARLIALNELVVSGHNQCLFLFEAA